MSSEPEPEDGSERIRSVRIEDEMEQSYIDYAMSVIAGRALPDARDGLKPVQRRILYAMHDMGVTSNAGHRKSSNIVGEAMGNYHPHGDASIYDALARMAQEFSLRYPMVDGQGNFGSVDGDPPAAMRYTEARMAPIAEEMLADISKDTVDFQANYDDRLTEPAVLPSAVPSLLLNGASGIAVGMSTNIPPHNLGEIVQAAVQVIREPETTVMDLLAGPGSDGPITGPDFPTGANIVGRQGIVDAYTSGRGKIRIRAEYDVENRGESDQRIVITELPYQENKARRIERIADDVNEGKIEGIADIRDQSDREGIRVVIDLKRGANADVVENQLVERHLETTFGVIALALVDGEPRVLDLKQLLEVYVDHRRDVVRRRTQYELGEAEDRAHILEGRLRALEHVDDVVSLIRASEDRSEAKEGLRARFELTDPQAEHIVRMQLGSLTSLEAAEIEDEYDDLTVEIERLRSILDSEAELDGVVIDELQAVAEQYDDERRTTLMEDVGSLEREDLIPEEDVVVVVTEEDYIKRMALADFETQHRGGKGIIGVTPKEGDVVSTSFVANSHDHLLCFTDRGQVYKLRVFQIPEMGRTARGRSATQVLALDDGEEITAVVNTSELEADRYLAMATRGGYVKRTKVSDFQNIYSNGIRATTLDEHDSLVDVVLTDGSMDLMIGTSQGMTIRFDETEARVMGRTARGVNGIKLQDGDRVAGMVATHEREGECLLTVTRNGFGKCTPLDAYRRQSRYGKGLIDIRTDSRNGEVVSLNTVDRDAGLVLMSDRGQIMRTEASEISTVGRNTKGVTIMDLEEDWVAGVDVESTAGIADD